MYNSFNRNKVMISTITSLLRIIFREIIFLFTKYSVILELDAIEWVTEGTIVEIEM